MSRPAPLLAFALLVVAAFIGSTIWSQRASHSIDDDALLISRHAAPAVMLVSDTRAELRDLEARVIRTVDGRSPGPVDVAASHARVNLLLDRLLASATGPEEMRLYGRLAAAVRDFDGASERALAQARAGAHAEARETIEAQLRPLADKVSETARELLELNAQGAESAAVRIEQARLKADRLAYALDGLCSLLALVVALVAFRIFRSMARVERDRAVLQQRKVEELEQFAGRVAHDVLSPLSSVGMAIGLVEKRAPGEAPLLQRAQAGLLRVRGIVDGLLEFARAGAKPEPGARSEVRPAVDGLVEELRPFAERNAAVLKISPIPACAVACSPGVLLSLLQNLLRNALKYLGDAQVREVSLRVAEKRGKVRFEIEDTGPGIPPQLSRSVFEPYVRGPNPRAPGIGLGLATVKRLAESHGGEVGLRQAASGGCLFWFELPESFPPEPSLEPLADTAHSG